VGIKQFLIAARAGIGYLDVVFFQTTGKEFPEDSDKSNKYGRAKNYLDTWINEGILLQSSKPSFYAYEMSYQVDGANKKLLGFLGLVKLEELGKGVIYPHECTYSKPKQDRLNLLRTCEANISPILYLIKTMVILLKSALVKLKAVLMPATRLIFHVLTAVPLDYIMRIFLLPWSI